MYDERGQLLQRHWFDKSQVTIVRLWLWCRSEPEAVATEYKYRRES
jgi:hypothetical protein